MNRRPRGVESVPHPKRDSNGPTPLTVWTGVIGFCVTVWAIVAVLVMEAL